MRFWSSRRCRQPVIQASSPASTACGPTTRSKGTAQRSFWFTAWARATSPGARSAAPSPSTSPSTPSTWPASATRQAGWLCLGPEEAAFADHVLAALGIVHTVAIGHSMGGDVALWLAADHPQRVDRLVLVDAAEIGQAAAVFRLAATPILGELMLKTATTPLTMHALMLIPTFRSRSSPTSWRSNTRVSTGHPVRARRSSSSPGRTTRMQRPCAPHYRISAPALVIWTDADPYFPVHRRRAARDELPAAELHVVHAAGHLPQEEQPAEFADVTLAWLLQR